MAGFNRNAVIPPSLSVQKNLKMFNKEVLCYCCTGLFCFMKGVLNKVNTFIDLIEVTSVTDNIVASVMAHREERNGWIRFQFREMPGLEVKRGMVLVCDTGRYTIIRLEKISGGRLQVLAQKIALV